MWDSDDVAVFLRGCACDHYAPAFARQNIDGRVILDLDMAALKELGVSKVGERVKILAAVKELRKRVAAARSVRSETASIASAETDSRLARLQTASARRLPSARPPPLNLQQSSRDGTYPTATKSPAPSVAQTPRPVQRSQRNPTTDATGFVDRPLPPAPTQSSAQSYALSVTQQQQSAEARPTLAERRAQPQVAALQASRNRLGPAHPFANVRAAQPPSPRAQPAPPPPPPPPPAPVPTTTTGPGPIPLEDLRKVLVKFIMQEDGQSRTVNLSGSTSGVEIMEKMLRKFGKWQEGHVSTDTESDDEDRLVLEGWGVFTDAEGVYPDGEANESIGLTADKPLSETALLGICLGTSEDEHEAAALRESGLYFRRIRKLANRKNMQDFFGDVPPPPMTPASPNAYYNVPRLGITQQAQPTLLPPTTKKMHRASTVSVLSGLGVMDVPPSPSTGRSTSSGLLSLSAVARNKKVHNFFGHRPPSEVISGHLQEFFPGAKRRELEKTVRHSTLRMSMLPQRHSGVAAIEPTAARASLEGRRMSDGRPSQSHKSRPVSTASSRVSSRIPAEPAPPMPQLFPPLLPPLESTESLSDSLQAYRRPPSVVFARRNSSESMRSRRSVLSSLRKARDVSDTASMLTVDEIAANVDLRRSGVYGDDDEVEAVKEDDEEEYDEEREKEEEEEDYEDEDEDEDEYESEESEEAEESEKLEGQDKFMSRIPTVKKQGRAFTAAGGFRTFRWLQGALIGAGSFGNVHLAMDAGMGLLMAVKMVSLDSGSSRNDDRRQTMVHALEHEIVLLKELQHPNIVQYIDSARDDKYLNIFLEYVPGGSVAALLNNYGAFEELLCRNFGRQILTGLAYLHEREIIHRDIKGANILVDNKGGCKISDFGISKKVESSLLVTPGNRASLQGSVFWMAPEVVKQHEVTTAKADIWSVGCVFVEMLTGTHPWPALSQMQALFKLGALGQPELPGDISDDAQDLLRQALNIDHVARPIATALLAHPFFVNSPVESSF
ncbi:ATP binding [Cryptotrichosporon argae]